MVSAALCREMLRGSVPGCWTEQPSALHTGPQMRPDFYWVRLSVLPSAPQVAQCAGAVQPGAVQLQVLPCCLELRPALRDEPRAPAAASSGASPACENAASMVSIAGLGATNSSSNPNMPTCCSSIVMVSLERRNLALSRPAALSCAAAAAASLASCSRSSRALSWRQDARAAASALLSMANSGASVRGSATAENDSKTHMVALNTMSPRNVPVAI